MWTILINKTFVKISLLPVLFYSLHYALKHFEKWLPWNWNGVLTVNYKTSYRRFESETNQELQFFSKIWLRHVYDIIAVWYICGKKENKGQLTFLDVLVIKNKNKLLFDIFRKETSTYRYIPNFSQDWIPRKMTSLNFLIDRPMNFYP